MTTQDRQGVDRRGVLVIHPGALGDVLLTRPVLYALRHQFPQHEIALLAGESVGVLLRGAGEVDRVFPLESMYLSGLFAGLDSLHPAFRTWLGNCNVAVGWVQDADGVIASTLRASGVGYTGLKSTSSSDLFAEHQAARYLEAVEVRGVSEMADNPLVLSVCIREEGKQILQSLNWNSEPPLVVIHPGSGSAYKCVEAWRLAHVIEWLSQAGMTPLLLEGPADREPVAQVLSALTIPVSVIRGLNVSAVAAVLAQAALYLGHDSGITHLAAALAIPTIACFGPTNPSRWAPLGPTVSVLSGMPCACSGWSAVERCQERVCLQIAPQRMIEACRAQLGRSR